jgi:hypothetical protein
VVLTVAGYVFDLALKKTASVCGPDRSIKFGRYGPEVLLLRESDFRVKPESGRTTGVVQIVDALMRGR